MKYLKMLGLAAIAALAFAAIAAAGTASAAVLCKEAPNKSGECKTLAEGGLGDYGSGSLFEAESSNATLTVVGSGVVSKVVCGASQVVLKSTATEGSPGVPGEVTDVAFSSCVADGSTGCTVSLVPTNDLGTGTLTVNGSAETEVVCGGFFKCKYKPTASGLSLHFEGGNPAKETASEQLLSLTAGFGFGCGSGAKWDANDTAVGANKAVWVATKMV
jgi:hypothetical protein